MQVESATWSVPVSQGEGKAIQPVSKSDIKPETTGFQKTIESKGIFVSLIIIFLGRWPQFYPMHIPYDTNHCCRNWRTGYRRTIRW